MAYGTKSITGPARCAKWRKRTRRKSSVIILRLVDSSIPLLHQSHLVEHAVDFDLDVVGRHEDKADGI